MLQRFFADPLNGPLLGSVYCKTRRCLCLAGDGLSITLEAFGRRRVPLMKLSSSSLKGSWSLASPCIKAFQPVILEEEGRVNEAVLLYSSQGIVLWHLEEGHGVDRLELESNEELVLMHVFTLSWHDSLGIKFLHHVLGAVTAEGVLFAKSYRFSPGVEPMCYRVKLPFSHILRARFSRAASNVVLCGVLDTEGSISFVELTPTSHPTLIGSVKNPRKSKLLDFLVLRTHGHSVLQLALAYADGNWDITELSDWKSSLKPVLTHEMSFCPREIRFLESELGMHAILSASGSHIEVHEVSSGTLLLSRSFTEDSIEDLDIFVNHTYRLEGLGLDKWEFFAPNSQKSQWMGSVQRVESFDFLIAFDLLEPFRWDSIPRGSCLAWKELMDRLGLELSLPHSWQDLRSSFDLINYATLRDKQAATLALLYLVRCGQPSQLATFCNTYSINCDMQTEALILIALDAGEMDKASRLKARSTVNFEVPGQFASFDTFEVDMDCRISFLIEKGLLCEALQVALLPGHDIDVLLQAIANIPELIAPFARVSFHAIDTSKPSIAAWSRTDQNASKLLHLIDICKRDFTSAIHRLQKYPWDGTEGFIESLEMLLHAKLPIVNTNHALSQPSVHWIPQRQPINFSFPKEFELYIALCAPSVTAPVLSIPLRPPTPTVPIERSESPVKSKSLAKASVHQPKAPSRLAEQVQMSDASLTESPATAASVDLREYLGATPTTRSSPRKGTLSSPNSPIRASPRLTTNSPSKLKDNAVVTKRASPTKSPKRSPRIHGDTHINASSSSSTAVSPLMVSKVTVRRRRKGPSTLPPLTPSDLPSRSASTNKDISTSTKGQKKSRTSKDYDHTTSPVSPGYSFRDSTVKQRTPHKEEEVRVESPSKRRLGLPPSKKLFPEVEAALPATSDAKKKRRKHRNERRDIKI